MNGEESRTGGWRLLIGWIVKTLAWLVGWIVVLAIISWFALFFGSSVRENPYFSGSPFTLAQIMAIFGGFGLAGGFSNYGCPQLRDKIRLVGVAYLISALGFTLLGMLIPLLPITANSEMNESALLVMIVPAFVAAIAGFVLGTILFLWCVGAIIADESSESSERPCGESNDSPSSRSS